jgi:hypothetical protein
MDAFTQNRIENSVLAFVTDHPNLSRDEIEKRIVGINPSTIRIALFHLQKGGLIEHYYERHADGKMYEHFRLASLDRP